MKARKASVYLFVLLSLALFSCKHFFRTEQQAQSEKQKYHSSYDDSTLNRSLLPVMMPYNRVIDPAGKVISYGSPDLENHSLDLKLIPGTHLFALEDRYGIAVLDAQRQQLADHWTFPGDARFKGFMSTYSGVEVQTGDGKTRIYWSAANADTHRSAVFIADWNGKRLSIADTIQFNPEAPSPLALPNELALQEEDGKSFLYVVLNGNNRLVKIDLANKSTVWSAATGVAPYGIASCRGNLYVTNWGGDKPGADPHAETAGVPYGKALVDPKTGSISSGSVDVFSQEGRLVRTIPVGLHPNDLAVSPDKQYLYVSNSNSDDITVINTATSKTTGTISVRTDSSEKAFIGDSPNALALSADGTHLYVANGMDNAIAVIRLGAAASAQGSGASSMEGFIPTEAYPGGLAPFGNQLFVTNLEGEGARVSSRDMKGVEKETGSVTAYNSHHQKATISVIDLPDPATLTVYTERVKRLMLSFRTALATATPRPAQPARPMPERIGEPSTFKHVLYIIKENRTYDQVLGDLPQGKGAPQLCVFGDSVTPNQHQLARNFLLLDNYYASGKCSAEGHQWTDAAMVTDYIEKNVRAWFRSYPHVQTDAMVYNRKGFIWNNAADHGKSVRIYGEACIPEMDSKLTWTNIYEDHYKAGKPLQFTNHSTISRVTPMLSPNYPGSDQLKITDQLRADAFIRELHDFEGRPGDQLPELMVMALSVDHTSGTRPGMPTPRAMVADNDLALGRIIEALTKSRFWNNTVVFITEDDSQAGWDHVSAYRTTGFVVSPYSQLNRTVSTNYNQTCIVRSIEQILGIPPMNAVDATALPMFDCFTAKPGKGQFAAIPNRIPLNEMNPALAMLKGKALLYARQSMLPEYNHIDGGRDDMLNRILWFSTKGSRPYPARLAGNDADEDDEDEK